MSEKSDNFKRLLDESSSWPTDYKFKFIVPANKINQLQSLIGDEGNLEYKPSKSGKFISVTLIKNMLSSDEVLQMYQRVQNIEGIISL